MGAVGAEVAGADCSLDCARVPSPFMCVARRLAVGAPTAGLGVTAEAADVVVVLADSDSGSSSPILPVRFAMKRGRAGGNCG